jgi:hypothetical protein
VGGGVLASNVAAVKFDFTNPPSENGYCGYAAIAVYGSPNGIASNQYGSANTYPFTPSWTVATNNDLIFGQTPSTATGNFSEEQAGRNVNSLTAGGSLAISLTNGSCSLNYVTCGNAAAGATVIYTLTNTAANGYNLTNIVVSGGWANNGRDAQAYTVYYSTVAAPATFIPLTVVNYNPTVPANTPSATLVSITPVGGGVLASNVAAVKFDFTNPPSENGYCGYAAIAMYGVASPSLPGQFIVVSTEQIKLSATCIPGNGFCVTVTGLKVGTNYVLQSTTDLGSGVWNVETNFAAGGSEVSFTNVTVESPQKFYRAVSF